MVATGISAGTGDRLRALKSLAVFASVLVDNLPGIRLAGCLRFGLRLRGRYSFDGLVGLELDVTV